MARRITSISGTVLAVLVLSATAVTGVATAATRTGAGVAAPAAKTAAVARSAKAGTANLGSVVKLGTVSTAQVQGGATGDGPADDDICESYALRLDVISTTVDQNMADEDYQSAYSNIDAYNNVEDMGEDAGCFFVD